MNWKLNKPAIRHRVASLGLVVILLTTAACSGGGITEQKGQTKDEMPKKPKITIAVNADRSIPQEEGTPENNRWIKWINENSPVEIQPIAITMGNESMQKYSTLFASDAAPDLIYSGRSDVMTALYNQKQLLPLDELVDKHSTLFKQRITQFPLLKKLGTKDGKLVLLGAVAPELYPNTVTYIRADWLKKLGLKMPETVEELLTTARAFATQDPDGNSKNDTYGIQLSSNANGALINIFGDVKWVVKNGEMSFDLQRSKSFAEFRKTAFEEGLVDKDYLTDANGTKAEQDWVNGRLGIYSAGAGIATNGYRIYETFIKNNPAAELAVLPNIKGPYGTFSSSIYNPIDLEVAVNAKAKDPVAVMKFIDFMIQPSTQKTLSQGLEGVHYKADGKRCSEPIDLNKNKIEMSGAFVMLEDVDCHFKVKHSLDSAKPTQKTFLDLVQQAEKNVRLDQPIPHFTHPVFLPTMPNEINLIHNNAIKAIDDLWIKSIVGGKSITIAQTYEDVQATWVKMGGGKVEEWYKNWYKDNKVNWVFTEELYKSIKLPSQK